MKIKYRASAHFDIDTEIDVSDEDAGDDLAIWLAIISDLESRYNLSVEFEKGETDNAGSKEIFRE